MERWLIALLLVLTLPGLLTYLPIRARRNVDPVPRRMIEEPEPGAAAREPLEMWSEPRAHPSARRNETSPL